MNAGFVAVTSRTSVDEARVARRRRARRTCPRRPCSSPRAGTGPTRRRARTPTPPSCVSVRVRPRADRRREVDAQRAPVGARELGHDVRTFVCLVCDAVRSGNRVDERRRFERQAVRPFTPEKNARPSQLTGAVEVGLRTRAAEDTGVLCRLSYVREGRRDSNPQPPCKQKEPPSAQQADSNFKERDNCRGIVVAARPGLEPGPPGSEPGVVPVPPPRTGAASMGLDGEIRTPNLRLPMPARCQLRHVQVGTDGGIRTRTDGGLSAVPLPVGLRQRVVRAWTSAGVEPATFSLQGSCASSCATGPGGGARAGIEPACRAYETSLIPDPPLRWGDRPDSNRLPPGPRPGVSTTSTSATVDEEGLEPPASSL